MMPKVMLKKLKMNLKLTLKPPKENLMKSLDLVLLPENLSLLICQLRFLEEKTKNQSFKPPLSIDCYDTLIFK